MPARESTGFFFSLSLSQKGRISGYRSNFLDNMARLIDVLPLRQNLVYLEYVVQDVAILLDGTNIYVSSAYSI
jgi:hypothetical protein